MSTIWTNPTQSRPQELGNYWISILKKKQSKKRARFFVILANWNGSSFIDEEGNIVENVIFYKQRDCDGYLGSLPNPPLS